MKSIPLILLLCVCGALAASRRSFLATAKPTAAAAEGFLLDENFEGVGTPTGWTTDVSAGGTITFDNTTSPLAGTEDCKFAPTTTTRIKTMTPALDLANCYVKFKVKIPDTAPASTTTFCLFEDTGATDPAFVRVQSTGFPSAQHGSATAASSGAALTNNTLFFFWIEYEKGTGANGGLDVFYATTDSKPGTPQIAITTGTATNNIDKVGLWASTRIGDVQFDDVQVDDAPIP